MNLQILHPLHLGDSSDLQVGQRVYAIGGLRAQANMCFVACSVLPDPPDVVRLQSSPEFVRQAEHWQPSACLRMQATPSAWTTPSPQA